MTRTKIRFELANGTVGWDATDGYTKATELIERGFKEGFFILCETEEQDDVDSIYWVSAHQVTKVTVEE